MIKTQTKRNAVPLRATVTFTVLSTLSHSAKYEGFWRENILCLARYFILSVQRAKYVAGKRM